MKVSGYTYEFQDAGEWIKNSKNIIASPRNSNSASRKVVKELLGLSSVVLVPGTSDDDYVEQLYILDNGSEELRKYIESRFALAVVDRERLCVDNEGLADYIVLDWSESARLGNRYMRYRSENDR